MKEICGCGKPARYMTIHGEYACNKYIRCSETPTRNRVDVKVEDAVHQILANIFCDDKLANDAYHDTDYKDMGECWNSMPIEDRNRIIKSVEDEIRKLL
jgi:hypothetical protein